MSSSNDLPLAENTFSLIGGLMGLVALVVAAKNAIIYGFVQLDDAFCGGLDGIQGRCAENIIAIFIIKQTSIEGVGTYYAK